MILFSGCETVGVRVEESQGGGRSWGEGNPTGIFCSGRNISRLFFSGWDTMGVIT